MSWNDGALSYGARKVKFYTPGTPGATGTTWTTLLTTASPIYILESFSVTRPEYVVKQYDEVRVPNGAFGVDDFSEGSAVVQFAPSQNRVTPGCAFTTTLPDAQSAESFVVTNVDQPEAQGDIRKQSIRFQKIVVATGPTVYPP